MKLPVHSPPTPAATWQPAATANWFLQVALAVALMINFALTGVIFNLTVTPGDAGQSVVAECAPRVPEKELCLRQQLQSAEEVFKRHVGLKDRLVGTPGEVDAPMSEATREAIYRAHPWARDEDSVNVFFTESFVTPRYPCPQEERVGNVWGDGGKWMCMVPFQEPRADLVIYSIGSGGSTQFEDAIFERLRSKTHTFDGTLQPHDAQRVASVPHIYFHPYSLDAPGADVEGKKKDIVSIMKELGHSFVDIYKIDCEGCEAGFVEQLASLTTREKPLFGQILMEVHNIKNLPLESRLFSRLRGLGYRLFHLEPNYFSPANVAEVGWIHEGLLLSRLGGGNETQH